jgi:hypothetical protein
MSVQKMSVQKMSVHVEVVEEVSLEVPIFSLEGVLPSTLGPDSAACAAADQMKLLVAGNVFHDCLR